MLLCRFSVTGFSAIFTLLASYNPENGMLEAHILIFFSGANAPGPPPPPLVARAFGAPSVGAAMPLHKPRCHWFVTN